MKLLFLTQVIDAGDAVLGFVPRWIQGLAQRCERVRVVALEAGDVSTLPGNVDVRVIGRRGVVRRWLRYRAVLSEALERDGFDAVLAHMVPRYALVAAGPARRAGARLYLWYTHKAVDARLRRAVAAVDKVFTASPESLRIATPRAVVTGHGIDLAHFEDRGEAPVVPARLLGVGRVTPAKDPLTLLAALSILVHRGHDLYLDLVGGGLVESDAGYLRTLQEQVQSGGLAERVVLHGPVPYRDVPAFYRRCTALVSASHTGSLDKVVLEAFACGRPVLSCNDAVPALLAPLGARAAQLVFPAGNAAALADRLEALLAAPELRVGLARELRAIVAQGHEVDHLMERLVREMQPAGATA